MAEDKEEQEVEQPAAESQSGGGKKKLIIIIVVAVLGLAALVGGTLFMLGFFDSSDSDSESDEEAAEETVAEAVDNKPKPAMYFPIKPAFVVNFPTRGRQRYLQVDVTVLTREMAVFDAMQKHMPLIKNRMNMLFSGEVYEELQTDEGKELLRQKSLEALQDIMQSEVGIAGVEAVLFTNFVMQ